MRTILLVDDDTELLRLVADVLAEPGHAVLTARDGYEAVRVLADRHVDLMISDLRMPGLDGLQLCRQAKVMRRRLRIMVLSGFADQADRAIIEALGGVLLHKPLRMDQLVSAVEAQLGRETA